MWRADISLKQVLGSVPASNVRMSVVMTSRTCAKRSISAPSRSVTMPRTLPSSTTTTAPWARLGIRLMASPTVVDDVTVTGVS